MQTKTFLRSILAVLVAAAPLTSYGRDRDRHDRHGHHGDRSRNYGHGHGHGGHGGHYYGRGSYYSRGYYGGSYYSPYYRSRSYWGPSFGLSFYSRPNYVYRGYVADSGGGGLAVDVQAALRRRGYYHGPIDGSIGPASRAAIRAYQANRGLYITGRIDRTLLRSLGIS